MTQSPKSGPLTANPEDPEDPESSARGARNVWGAPGKSMTHHESGKLSLCAKLHVWTPGTDESDEILMNLQDLHLLIPVLMHNMPWYLLISKAEVTRISCICWKFQRVSWSWSPGSGLDSLQRSTKAFGRERKIPCGTLDTPHRRSQKIPKPEPFGKQKLATIERRRNTISGQLLFSQDFEDKDFAFSFSILLLNLLKLTFDLAFKLEIMKWLWFTPFSCFVVPKSSEHVLSSLKVVAIKQITEDAQMRSEQQLAFVREMSVLTQVPPRHCIRSVRIIW